MTAIMAVLLLAVAGSSLGGRPTSLGRPEQTPLLDATFARSLFALVDLNEKANPRRYLARL